MLTKRRADSQEILFSTFNLAFGQEFRVVKFQLITLTAVPCRARSLLIIGSLKEHQDGRSSVT
jgi:hypothetical protein